MLEGAAVLFDGPEEASDVVVLAHGAGAPMDSPFMSRIAQGLAARGLRVARFEFPYMRSRRVGERSGAPDREPVLREAWTSIIERLGGGPRLIIGGKSLGGRREPRCRSGQGARIALPGLPVPSSGRTRSPADATSRTSLDSGADPPGDA